MRTPVFEPQGSAGTRNLTRRSHHNRFNGDFFGGIYATCIANFLGITIREDDIELPPVYLDYEAMVRHRFVERNDQFLQYRIIFDKRCTYHVALPASTFFDFQAKRRYFITREEVEEYKRRAKIARLQAAAHDAMTAASQYDPNYNFGYPPGHPWK